MSFEWDDRKASSNATKHGITFAEAATVFADPSSLTIADPIHSQMEERLITLGRSSKGNFLVVVHTERDDSLRIISCRKANRREKKTYEENL